MLVLTVIDLTFIASKLSTTALIGILDESKFVIIILDLSLTILPLHLRGLNRLIGVMDN